MSVNSIEFLLFFIIAFFVYFFLLKEKTKKQNAFLLLASYFFYGYADLKMLPLLILATLVYYYLGIGIAHFNLNGTKKRGSTLTTLGIAFGIVLLLYFKYLNFFVTSFSEMFESVGFHTDPHTFNIILPLGISFFTFRLIGYVIEVNRGTLEPTRNILTFGTYVAFFPSLLSGPIDRPQKFIPQLEKKRPFNYEMAVDGLRQVLWGMFKKMVVADNLANVVNTIWSDYSNQSGSTLLLGAIFYSFQIYADFSGYSDMAIGISKILGFDVAKNFNYPYFSRNMSEFWRKWHMSLTSWLTDYIYIPLGGSRCNKARHFLNTMIVFTLCGFWHGANWTFVLWGAYNGLLFLPLVLRKKKKLSKVVAEGKLLPNITDLLNMLGTFLLATLGWILFRAESVGQAFDYIAHIFNVSKLAIPSKGEIGILYIVVLVMAEWLQRKQEFPLQIEAVIKSPVLKWGLYYLVIVLILFFSGSTSQFIYSQF